MVNFDKLQDKVLDIKGNLYNECLAIREQVCAFLFTRPNKRFTFANEIKEKINFSVAYRGIDKLGMHNAKRMKVVYIEYTPKIKDFVVHGYISNSSNDVNIVDVEIAARNLDLDSLGNIVDYLAQYQREQDGTTKTPKQIEHEENEENFGKEFYTNEKYRLFIETQLEPEERLMLAVYNNAPEANRKNIPLPLRTRFALVLREC